MPPSDIPILTIKQPEGIEDPQLVVSPASILLDDEPLPWPTVGPARIEIADDQVVTLVLRIPVRI